jgi:hypothetical protein
MTDFKSKLRKILEELCEEYHAEIEHGSQQQKIFIEPAVENIIALFISKLPTKKETYQVNTNDLLNIDYEAVNASQYEYGFNQCLADIKGEIE